MEVYKFQLFGYAIYIIGFYCTKFHCSSFFGFEFAGGDQNDPPYSLTLHKKHLSSIRVKIYHSIFKFTKANSDSVAHNCQGK